jgi:hypothetical protein
MKKWVVVILFLFIVIQVGFSQKQIISSNQDWLGTVNQTRFSNRWGSYAEVLFRSKALLPDSLYQIMIRVAGVYYLSNTTRLSIGYAYEDNFPADNHKKVYLPLHSPWQQFSWGNKYNRLNVNQGLRLEERFRHKVKNDYELAQGYSFNYRLRYNIVLNAALGKRPFEPNTLALVVTTSSLSTLVNK